MRISSKLSQRKTDMSSIDHANLQPIGTLQFEKIDLKVGENARILAFFVSLTSCYTYPVEPISMILRTIRVPVALNNR